MGPVSMGRRIGPKTYACQDPPGKWLELRSLTAILGGKIGGGRAPGETLRILWEIEQRHRERRLPERTPASDM